MPDRPPRALLVDLNNFAAYPTLAIGYLVASLRADDIDVEVLSPLRYGVAPAVREPAEGRRVDLVRRINQSSNPVMARAHDAVRAAWAAREHRVDARVVQQVAQRLHRGEVDVLLLSAYLDHYPSVRALCAVAGEHGIPVLVGGPMFAVTDIAQEWLDLPGLTAVVGGEVELTLPSLVRGAIDGADLSTIPGVFLPDGRGGRPAAPLADLSVLPIPDLSDFPWDQYPRRIIPVMTGRGCSWGRCLFCSDVITSNGRTNRSRPVEAVLDEMVAQSERHGSRDFIFLDIKLNSSLEMWRGLIEGIPRRLPGARWIGTVHVAARGENGLTADDLAAARAAGMQRISFGLETGSQALNDKMAKGTSLQRTSAFLADAKAAALSVRTTMMLGYPGETAGDVRQTIDFLSSNDGKLARIALGRFKAIPGTRFHDRYTDRPNRYADLRRMRWNPKFGRAGYFNSASTDREYRRAKTDLLSIVHQTNRRPLPAGANVFDGVM